MSRGGQKTCEPAQPGKPNRKMVKRGGWLRVVGLLFIDFRFQTNWSGRVRFSKANPTVTEPARVTLQFFILFTFQDHAL